METTAERRSHPSRMWANARTAIMVGMNYGPDRDPLAALENRAQGAISVYAKGRDYHRLIKGKLKHLAGFVARRAGGEVKVFVDTAPLMEKPLAERAGLGWQGKHTNLVSRAFGSWLFLGRVLSSLELSPDAPESDHCGACRVCLDACPTGAFVAPYQLDARACLSYLTIEHAGPIPHRFRKVLGNRVFGCDDCLAVCPWNKFAAASREAGLAALPRLEGLALDDLASLDVAAFRRLFSATAIKRIGRERLVRNALYAIGNSGKRRLAPAARALLDDPDPAIAEAADWALCRLAERAGCATAATASP
ncbi:MAG: tRNA epoxyqueuosine(34) reductase QueG, partial [Caulobacteraceae bacterium]